MDKNILKKLLIENQSYIAQVVLYRRNYSLEENANYVLTGSRRVGKSYFMYEIAKNFLSEQITKEHFLFINFEDERLLEFRAEHFDLLIDSYAELYDLKPIFFLDEVQNIFGWEKFVRRLADKNFRVYVTGSNAKMLSKQIATTLGGRFLIKEIQTLSFKEFLTFNKLELEKNYEFTGQLNKIKHLLAEYFAFGAFPEIIKFTNKREYLSSLFQKVLYGDILLRHTIKNKLAMKLLVKKMAESVNDQISFNRIKNLLKSTGLSIGTNTLIEYFDYLKESFLLYDLKNYASTFSKRETKKKFYFTDNGILSLFFPNDKSKLLENLVYTQLRRKYLDTFYFYKRNFEVDFFIPQTQELIQVSYTLNKHKTKERELKSLKAAMLQLEIKSALIITYEDKEQEIIENDLSIKIIPLWKWLLV